MSSGSLHAHAPADAREPAGVRPRACVIGAGSSGIAAAKALHERGIPFDCFEKSDRVGGNWVFENINGMSASYRELFINTKSVLVNGLQRCSLKASADFAELHRGGGCVAQSFANRHRQLGEAV